MFRWLMTRVNIWVILIGLLVAAGLIALVGILLVMLPSPASQAQQSPPAVLTVIAAPTPTLTPSRPTNTPTPTLPLSVGGISVGSFVQITGTEGQGLRIRSGPGTSNPPRFLAMDAEVFQVKDGPQVADGFTWWYLEASYDPGRSGWAASAYLTVVATTPVP